MTSYVLGAGFFLISLAIFVQGILPIAIPESRETRATRAVRNELGEIKWVWYEASPYTPLEQLGRNVYQREGCWYCHSQYVRPVAGEDQRWGPVSQVGEYAYDRPHLLSTRRIGPDLTRVGLKYSDHWHYAHHWESEMVVPDTIMPDFRWLFRTTTVTVVDKDGEPALSDTPGLRGLFTFKAERSIPLHPNPEGLAFAEQVDGTPLLAVKALPEPYNKLETWKGKALTVIVPTEEMRGLVAYLQKLGTNRGAWRDVFEPQNIAASVMSVPQTDGQVARGKQVYERRCVGCHGVKGDGNGPAATFLDPRPRDFTLGAFKFRTTPSGSLPTDGDLYRTLSRGVRWTAMPTWHEIPEKDRIAVIAFIKTLSPRWKEERPEPPIIIGDPPKATRGAAGQGQRPLREGQVLGVPRRRRQGRWALGRAAPGRSGLQDPPRRLHAGPVQGRRRRAGHLPHDDHRARWHRRCPPSPTRWGKTSAGPSATSCCPSRPSTTRSPGASSCSIRRRRRSSTVPTPRSSEARRWRWIPATSPDAPRSWCASTRASWGRVARP